ncbi:MAG: cyclic nucleotide-binding/CBS domain-containing protein [Trueperaceae bacterium]|nr:cyclic nucleotide-binding/CBS domain-containing protein [Trueperaceae bacterium]
MTTEQLEVFEFLKGHAPFDSLEPEGLGKLVAKLELTYYRRSSTVFKLSEANHYLYCLRSGAVELRDSEKQLISKLGEGECFGYPSLLKGAPTELEASCTEDSLIYLLPQESFHALRQENTQFDHFFSQAHAARVKQALKHMHVSVTGMQLLTSRVKDLIEREPICIEPEKTVHEAAQAMSYARVSSLLVMKNGQLIGIITDRDMRKRVIAEGKSLSTPVAEVMTQNPISISGNAYAFELILTMTQYNVHHLPILENQQLIGIVTTTDLLRFQSINPIFLVGEIAKQQSVEGLASISRRLPEVVRQLVEADATANDIGRIVTAIGDGIEKRLLELAETQLGPAPIPYVWMVLGSQARLEQSAQSDQDNALIFDDSYHPEHDGYFSKLCHFVSDGLNACGYPYCPGNVMASNQKWRQPLKVWQGYFEQWLYEPQPEALLHSSIFFDMRPLYGQSTLFESLQRTVLEAVPKQKTFLAYMAKNALEHRPPLGFFRQFVLESGGEHAQHFDLKHKGMVPIIDLARLYALEAGIASLNTQERLSAAIAANLISEEAGNNLQDALEYIAYIRLRHQGKQVRAGEKPNNFVSPDELSSFERRHLKDAFQIVNAMQSNLSLRYPLRFLS